jgi:hypothetical protein
LPEIPLLIILLVYCLTTAIEIVAWNHRGSCFAIGRDRHGVTVNVITGPLFRFGRASIFLRVGDDENVTRHVKSSLCEKI